MREGQVQRGKEWLEKLLELMAIPSEVKIGQLEVEPDGGEVSWLIIEEKNLAPEQIEILLGHKGETIDAIQYLTNTLLNMGVGPENQRGFTVELNGYRVTRQRELQALVEKVAEQVRETGMEVEMKSLSSAERRQIHSFLKNSEDLKTESRGQEPDRRLVVKLR